LHTAADAMRVRSQGYRLALVGTALMRSDDPATLIKKMRAAGKSGVDV
jgi:indole-3-glycerol phosphate synthase